jgi:hypothetical protein
MRLSEKGLKLIIEHEVGGGKSYYDKFLAVPTWPGHESGITIGVGYDLGYATETGFNTHWKELDEEVRERLSKAIGIKGANARAFVSAFEDIRIDWSLAIEVFKTHTCAQHMLAMMRFAPASIDLPEDAQAALFSLVFNRGASTRGERRAEMAQIAHVISAGQPEKVPYLIRAMKRLWPQGSGLLRRREDEAKLWESAFNNIA